MNQTVLIAIIIVALIFIGLFVALVRQPRSLDSTKPATIATPAPKGVITSGTTAVGDVASQLLDIKVDPSAPADDLSRIKGLGPKAAAQLKAFGITRFDQLGSLDGAQTAALDAQMGAFKGRIARDRWIEQARYLARGDTSGFEAEFGKLG